MKRKSESLTAGGKVCSAVGREGGVAAATDEATAANGSQSVLGTQSVWASRWVSKNRHLGVSFYDLAGTEQSCFGKRKKLHCQLLGAHIHC